MERVPTVSGTANKGLVIAGDVRIALANVELPGRQVIQASLRGQRREPYVLSVDADRGVQRSKSFLWRLSGYLPDQA
jgi:hypothetical protein